PPPTAGGVPRPPEPVPPGPGGIDPEEPPGPRGPVPATGPLGEPGSSPEHAMSASARSPPRLTIEPRSEGTLWTGFDAIERPSNRSSCRRCTEKHSDVLTC